jgi:hypothetical protein
MREITKESGEKLMKIFSEVLATNGHENDVENAGITIDDSLDVTITCDIIVHDESTLHGKTDVKWKSITSVLAVGRCVERKPFLRVGIGDMAAEHEVTKSEDESIVGSGNWDHCMPVLRITYDERKRLGAKLEEALLEVISTGPISGCAVIQMGEATAIICGGKRDHECDSDGPGVLVLDDGTEIPETKENYEKFRDRVRGGSVTCSVCGRSAISDAPYM